MDFVRRGGRLGLVCDLYDKHGMPVPFFGKLAPSVVIPAMIARRVGARIWMARCLRIGNQSRFTIELKELKVPRTANQADDVKWITTAMQTRVRSLDPRGAGAVDVVEPAVVVAAWIRYCARRPITRLHTRLLGLSARPTCSVAMRPMRDLKDRIEFALRVGGDPGGSRAADAGRRGTDRVAVSARRPVAAPKPARA